MNNANRSEVNFMTNKRNNNSNDMRGGFLGMSKLGNYFLEYNVPVNANKVDTEHFKKFIKRNKPYSFFITLTFGRYMKVHECCKYTNKLLERFNKKIFGRDYGKKSDFIEGFAFFEDHKMGTSRNDLHIHILVKYNERYDRFSFTRHKNIFYDAASHVVDGGKVQVFFKECIDFQAVRDDGAIEYCFKQIWDKNLSRIKFIGRDGLSDSL